MKRHFNSKAVDYRAYLNAVGQHLVIGFGVPLGPQGAARAHHFYWSGRTPFQCALAIAYSYDRCPA